MTNTTKRAVPDDQHSRGVTDVAVTLPGGQETEMNVCVNVTGEELSARQTRGRASALLILAREQKQCRRY